MIDSIYTGITGVRTSQSRMNVIGNNVANINTTAFKAGRVAFSEVMSRTLSEGAAATDGISARNPLQTGLGVKIASIDTIQRQGSLQQTGIDTDLAIEGGGFFYVTDGVRDFFTRDGTFAFDSSGNLVDPSTGLQVKGNQANHSPGQNDISFAEELAPVKITLDRESPAIATTTLRLAGNLDASGGGAAVWTEDTAFGIPARHAGLSEGELANLSTQLSGQDPGAAKLSITLGQGEGGIIDVPIKSFDTIAQLRDELNALIYANDDLKGKVLFTGELVAGSPNLTLRSIEGGSNVSITVDDGGTSALPISSLLGFTSGTTAFGGSASPGVGQSLNELANVGEDLTEGDILRFTGVKPGGQRFDGELIIGATGERDTLDDLLAAVSDTYGGVVAGIDLNTGKLTLTEETAAFAEGNRVVGFDVSFSLLDQNTADRENKSALAGAEPPFSFSTNTQVFDEQGETHSLTFNFTKKLVENEWNWSATIDGLTPDTGNVGNLIFLSDGTIDVFQSTDGQDLSITPTNGASPLVIDIETASPDGALTQFGSPSSAAVREQDGRGSGNLVSVVFEENGNIRGLFDNADSQVLARLKLAVFANAGGLRREGDNLFVNTTSSGEPDEREAMTQVQSAIRAGHVELSNVDLAEEFTNMIVTQRGFQASARSITTSDELLSELVNLKR
ncbi:MAG: flagellar hook-basal body complex protein [Candidatus Latescibacterota bacterium]|nr:flagellar hook-basal body complex protein [Candidatus Latescibacterota bacterium]